MYFDIEENPTCQPLPHTPFNACVVPRPIGWISTLSAGGVANAAPYSFFNGVATQPPMIMYSNNGMHAQGPKDTLVNIEATGEFVVNIATWDLREAMNRTSFPAAPGDDEIALAGLTTAASRKIKAPRIKESPVNMECVLHRMIDLPCSNPDGRNIMVIGRVVALHIDETVMTDGLVDAAKLRPLARLGYRDYARIDETFTIPLPSALP